MYGSAPSICGGGSTWQGVSSHRGWWQPHMEHPSLPEDRILQVLGHAPTEAARRSSWSLCTSSVGLNRSHLLTGVSR